MKGIFTDFRVVPHIVVRSPELRIPELVLFLVLFAFVVGYGALYELHFLARHPLVAEGIVELGAPLSNFWTCSNHGFDCKLAYLDPVPYCTPEAQQVGDYVCKKKTAGMVEPDDQIPSARMAVTLSELNFPQYSCEHFGLKEGVDCWGFMKDPVFVPQTQVAQDVESNHAMFRSAWVDSLNPSYVFKGVDIQSLLTFTDPITGQQDVRRLPTYNVRSGGGKELSNDIPNVDYFRNAYPEVCGTDTGDGESCFGGEFADYISLRVLLRAAGISNLTVHDRRQGIILEVLVTSTNADHNDFWTWPFGRKQKVVYTPVVRRLSHSDSINNEYQKEKELNSSVVMHRSGHILLVQAYHTGTYATFDPLDFASRFAIASTILASAHFFVRYVLSKAFEYVRGLQHIPALLKASSAKATPHSDDFIGMHDDYQIYEVLEGGRGGRWTTDDRREDDTAEEEHSSAEELDGRSTREMKIA
eukprot:TRINITY_DN2655_c0_g1_i2.p1 TRINITY_DN2655_c0_g1~~TRINITY_DN2655_c0_g1_i2.p1  ORF type:complete len:472 (-),score=33.08 TRINITY_DN2655_c0_g1_i2:397-1812(-)